MQHNTTKYKTIQTQCNTIQPIHTNKTILPNTKNKKQQFNKSTQHKTIKYNTSQYKTRNTHNITHHQTIQHNTTQYKTKQHKQNHTHIIQTILHITNQLNIIKIEPKHYKQRKQQNTILHKTTQYTHNIIHNKKHTKQ